MFMSIEQSLNEVRTLKKDLFIILRSISITSSAIVELYYHIESEKIFAVKRYRNKIEKDKLSQRELENYKSINYPFIPKIYGTIEDKDDKDILIVMEFINGKTLSDCQF